MRKIALHSITILLFLCLGISSGYTQYDTTWIKTYGGNRNDKALDMIQTPDYGFMIIGSTSSYGFDNSQMYFLKLDSIGDIMWSKSHGGPGQEWGTSVIHTSDGGYLGVGYTNSWGAGGFDIFMVKLDSNGNLEYEKVRGGADWDFGWDVIEVSPGEYVIAAETQSFGDGDADAWIVKYNENTDVFEWETIIGDSTYENFKAVAKGANGEIIAAGSGIAIDSGRVDEDVMLTKFDSLGNEIWTKFYGDTLQDYANDIIYMSNGNYSITGVYTPSSTPQSTRTNILQVTDTGSIRYQHIWGTGFVNSVGNKIMEADSLRIAVVSTYEIQSGNTDVGIAFSIPNAEWYQQGSGHGTIHEEFGHAGVYLNGEGFALAGYTNGYESSYTDIVVYKTDKDCLIYYDQTHEFVPDTVIISAIESIRNTQKIKYNTSLNIISSENESLGYDFKVYDLSGHLVFKGALPPSQTIEINNLPISNGAYFFIFSSKDQVSINHLMVVKNSL